MKGGEEIYDLAKKLWPINRSITGDGVRQTLDVISQYLPDLQVNEVPSGTVCFDWIVPREWRVREAWIKDSTGKIIVDFKINNLHLVGYSTPVDLFISLSDLQAHLHSLPEKPNAIPYITSYYSEYWGFCLSQNERNSLRDDIYHVYIDSDLFEGSLTYGELYLPGDIEKEVLLSTYVCHPSMANNELSGPCVATAVGYWLKKLKKRKYSYRLIFIPETIGSILYISKNFKALKENLIAGFVLTCIGDEREYSYLASRNGNTYSDKAAMHVLQHIDHNYKKYSFLERGSDERQFCSPGVDLPICSVMRSKYATYPEYHTSLDNLDYITPAGLEGGFNVIKRIIETFEYDCVPILATKCEPQLGKRGLYPTLSTADSTKTVKNMMNLIAYSDGAHSLLDIADKIGVAFWDLVDLVDKLTENGVLKTEQLKNYA